MPVVLARRHACRPIFSGPDIRPRVPLGRAAAEELSPRKFQHGFEHEIILETLRGETVDAEAGLTRLVDMFVDVGAERIRHSARRG